MDREFDDSLERWTREGARTTNTPLLMQQEYFAEQIADDPLVFSSSGDSFTGFDGSSPYIGMMNGLTAGGDNGRPGGALNYQLVLGGSETAVRADYRSLGVRKLTFDMRIPAASMLSTLSDHTLVHIWDDAYADFLQLRFDTDGTTWALKVVDPTAGYATILDVPDRLSKDLWYTIGFQITDTKIIIRINGRLCATLNGRSQATKNLGVCAIGSFYDNAIVGAMYIDNITLDNNTVVDSAGSARDQLEAVYRQYITNHVRADGMPIRPYPDGLNGSFAAWSDSTSETVSYILMMAVQFDDQETFELVATWAYNNMRRGAQGLTNVPNLYSWHWNMETNAAYDQNSAHDADFDIITAYYWAHGRWGSNTTNYLARANAMSGDLIGQAYTNGSLKYIPSDYVQGLSTPFEVNPSYYSPVAMQLAKQYDTANASAWQQAIDGMYDMLERARDFVYSPQTVYSGLPPNWGSFNPSTQVWSAGGRTLPDVYSYEAFRSMWRIKLDWQFYGSTPATTLYSLAKTFFISEWTTDGIITAEYRHDGTNNGGPYEKSIFTYAAHQAITINDAANSTAAAIFSAKLAGLYVNTIEGHIYRDGPSGTAYAYFDQSWLILDELQRQGMSNFGGVSGSAPTTITGTGFANTQAFGAAALSMTVSLAGSGFSNTNSFGSGALTSGLTIAGTGYANTNQFGSGTVTNGLSLAGTGFANTNSFGAGVVTTGPAAVTGTGFANTNQFGSGSLTRNITVTGSGYQNTNGFGSGSLARTITVTGTGYANSNTFGAGSLSRTITLQGTGFSNTNGFGAGSLTRNITITGTGRASTVVFGAGVLAVGARTIVGTGFANTNQFGSGSLSQTGAPIYGTGYANQTQFGAGYLVQVILTSSNLVITSVEDNLTIVAGAEDRLTPTAAEDRLVITSVEDNLTIQV